MKEFLLSFLLFASVAQAQNTDFTAGTADIIDLTDQTGVTSWNLSDDGISNTINLDFSFDFYGETFTSGKGATNGCWTFTGYNNTCSDYTPDPLPQSGMDMTIFPLWGDWIRDNGSKMLYKTFGDTADTDQYFVLGWYNMREYNRASDNTFEMLLYEGTNKIEFRYGDLDIIKHDIVVGVQGHATSSSNSMYNANEYKVYLHHNECASGTQHDSYDTNCVNTNWNDTSHNTAIENKYLYITVEDQYGCAANTLLASTCEGYAAAYLLQQCNLDVFYSVNCVGYDDALFDRNCDDDSQFSPSCPGYSFQESAAYFVEEQYDYGYDEFGYGDDYSQGEDYFVYEDESLGTVGYEEVWDDDPYANMDFIDEEWYEIDSEEFGQEQVDEWYGAEVSFDEEDLIVWEDSSLESWDELDVQMDEYDEFVEVYEEVYYEEEYFDPVYEEEFVETLYIEEEYIVYEELYEEPIEVAFEYELEYETPLLEDVLMQNFEHEQIVEVFYEEEPEFLEFETIEELDEWFEEEMEEEQFAEEVIEESIEEELLAEEREELEETIEEEEFEVVAREDNKGDKKEMQLNVVANTVRTATNSMSGTTSGTSMQSTGNSVASGGVSSPTATAVASSASGGGMSISSSPSISAQFTSATAQTQTLLDMSSAASTGGSMSTDMGSLDSGITSVASADTSFSTDMASVDSGSTVEVGASAETEVASGDTEVTVADTGSSDTTSGSSGTVSVSVVPMQAFDGSPQVVMAEVQVQNMQGEIDTAISGVMTASEADQIADKIIAQNIKEQQEEQEAEQQQTGQYADSTTLIAYMGYVPGFNTYSQVQLPQATEWYKPVTIYSSITMMDNVQAFYGMYADSLSGMNNLINMQPKL